MRGMILPVILSVGLLTACGDGSRTSTDRAAAADSTAIALNAYEPAAFDTISWAADSVAVARGQVVWSYSCQKCHGTYGLGDGDFVLRGDTLRPPSLLEPHWRFSEDTEALRKQIFVGTNEGMPHWGLTGLKLRDIDAAALYIQKVLRRYGTEAAGRPRA
jgi:mono/diheme cytochrome c family protein